jgi:hypothetical protein
MPNNRKEVERALAMTCSVAPLPRQAQHVIKALRKHTQQDRRWCPSNFGQLPEYSVYVHESASPMKPRHVTATWRVPWW